MKRAILMIIPVLICGMMFLGCNSDEPGDKEALLEGSVWQSQVDEVVHTLTFTDKNECTLTTGRTDGTYSVNRTSYFWRYSSDIDSLWGLFHIYFTGTDKDGKEVLHHFASGTIEDKKLYLSTHDKDGAVQNYSFRKISDTK